MMKSFFKVLAIVVPVILSGSCNRNKTAVSGQNLNESDTISNDHLYSLPQLEAGVVKSTDVAFGPIIKLKGEPLTIKENIKPEQLFIKGNYLITNNQRSDSIFMIFELPGMKCVAAFGIKGMGPDEFAFPMIVETAEDSILFYIYESINDKVYKVRKVDLTPVYYLTLPGQDRTYGDKQLYFVDERTAYYVESSVKGKEISRYLRDSIPHEKIINDLSIPEIKKGSWTTCIGDFGLSIKHQRMAFAYKYFKRLKIIDLQSMKEKIVVFNVEDLEEGQSDIANLAPTNITHFWGMSSCRDCFYMLYSGRTPVDVMRDNKSGKKYIFVEKYDWNGNPLRRYELDDWGYFCVDDKTNILYLASTISINPLLMYDISENTNQN